MAGLTLSSAIKRAFGVLTLLASSQALAIGGVGDVVSDPGSYAYMVEMVKNLNAQIDVMKEQLDKAKKIQRDTERTRRSMEGVYNDVQDVHDEFTNIQDIKDVVNSRDDVFQVVGKGSKLASKFPSLGLDKMEKKRETKKGSVTQRDYGSIYDALHATPKTGDQQREQAAAKQAIREESDRTKFTEASVLIEELARTEQRLNDMADRVRANKDNLKGAVDINTHTLLDMHKTLISLTRMIAREQLDENLH